MMYCLFVGKSQETTRNRIDTVFKFIRVTVYFTKLKLMNCYKNVKNLISIRNGQGCLFKIIYCYGQIFKFCTCIALS